MLVVRLDPAGAASRAGIRKGMVIVRVGNRPVRNTEDFADIMESESLRKGSCYRCIPAKGLGRLPSANSLQQRNGEQITMFVGRSGYCPSR